MSQEVSRLSVFLDTSRMIYWYQFNERPGRLTHTKRTDLCIAMYRAYMAKKSLFTFTVFTISKFRLCDQICTSLTGI